MPKPTIVIVPGFWEGTLPFTDLTKLLQSHAYSVMFAPLLSTGQCSPNNPTMHDDIAGIRGVLAPLIEQEKKSVLLVCHSAGGFLGSAAIEGLIQSHRVEKGLEGGVIGLVLLAAGIAPEGHVHTAQAFMDFSEAQEDGSGAMWCKDPRQLLFNDISDEHQAWKWVGHLKPQPASGWDDVTKYAGWKDVKSYYLVCENDKVLPDALQVQCAQLAGAEIVRCEAGHMVQITMPEKVVEIVRRAVGEEV
jgi:pimeloyl-ACP methyl ester carboxylesterase